MVSVFLNLIKMHLNNYSNLSISDLTEKAKSEFLKSPICSSCGKNELVYLCEYERYVVDWQNGKKVDIRIRTFRYQCSCGKTHVILPVTVIPYTIHSMNFIIHVLSDYHSHRMTVVQICEKYGISAPTLYRWRDLFENEKKSWLKSIRTDKQSLKFLENLFHPEHLMSFCKQCICHFPSHRHFLQSHPYAWHHNFALCT